MQVPAAHIQRPAPSLAWIVSQGNLAYLYQRSEKHFLVDRYLMKIKAFLRTPKTYLKLQIHRDCFRGSDRCSGYTASHPQDPWMFHYQIPQKSGAK